MRERTNERLHAYLDGELDAKERPAVEAWLAEDAAARAELEALRRIRETTRTAAPELPGLDAEWSRLSAGLESERDAPAQLKGGRTLLPFALPLSLGAAAAALLAGLFIWNALSSPGLPAATSSAELVELVETDLEDSSTIVYIDPQSGWTVVWVEEDAYGDEPLG